MGTILVLILALSGASAETPEQITSPYIENETLYIQGPIDSHMYDYLTFPNQKMSKVKTVALDSWGGNHNWALAIAEKIQLRGWNTRVAEGSHCASACVYLFGAGAERLAHETVWFGIHGARMGKGYMVEFAQSCISENNLVANDSCQALSQKNYDLNFQATREAFQLLEDSGVSPFLWTTYMNFKDVDGWHLNFNFLKKPDWVLKAPEALDFDLVTELLPTEPHQ